MLYWNVVYPQVLNLLSLYKTGGGVSTIAEMLKMIKTHLYINGYTYMMLKKSTLYNVS